MKPATPDPAEPSTRLNQQLILAQVRIMELEDARAELAAQLARLVPLLTETQTVANARIAERDHLLKLKAEMDRLVNQLNQELGETRTAVQHWQSCATDLGKALSESVRTAAERNDRIAELESQLQAIKASRSWRWTAPLRSLENWFRRTPRA